MMMHLQEPKVLGHKYCFLFTYKISMNFYYFPNFYLAVHRSNLHYLNSTKEGAASSATATGPSDLNGAIILPS